MDEKLLAMLLVIAGIAGLAYITTQGSTLFYVNNVAVQQPYVQPVNTPQVNSQVVGGSLQLTGKIYFYTYQQQEANYVGQILQQYGVNPIGINVDTPQGQAMLQQVQAQNPGYTTLPLVQIGRYIFEVSPTYINYAVCPGNVVLVDVGGINVPFCEYNGEYLFMTTTLSQLVSACEATNAPSCYS